MTSPHATLAGLLFAAARVRRRIYLDPVAVAEHRCVLRFRRRAAELRAAGDEERAALFEREAAALDHERFRSWAARLEAMPARPLGAA